MRIALLSLEDGITATGFRKMAGFVARIHPDTRVHYVGTSSYWSFRKSLQRGKATQNFVETDEAITRIAESISKFDIVGFSSMTGYADLTRRVSRRLREINPKAFQIWGGIHPIIYAEDAIQSSVDAICTGEGELAFAEFFERFRNGSDYTKTASFWFNHNGSVIRNPFRPLMSPAELETLPFPKYGGEEFLFGEDGEFRPATHKDYLANNGLAYPAVWSIGCPLHCTFCGNTVFIANDPEYRKIRHPSPAYIIGEVRQAKKVHPHLTSVQFFDDSFLALPLRDLTTFATEWREQIGIPFAVYGVIPTYVNREKLEVLTWAGLNRVRMGIQSGSERILKFYRRPTPVPRVEQAAAILSEFKAHHINPAYDIIVDNPVETREDVLATLELAYRLARPFTLNIFSLRVIPNTVLEKQMQEEGLDLEQINASYHSLRPTWANILLYMLMLWRPPRRLFDLLLKRVRAFSEPQSSYPILIRLIRIPWLLQQGFRHLRFGEFSLITGTTGFVLWKLGIVSLLRKLRPEPLSPLNVRVEQPGSEPAPVSLS
ncbi:MAG TPA: radical SAM protein [Thermoanaerobaculia bacterium]|nr:radical SAM protein [Thermoanaerobaculia bacterium]